MAQIRIATFHPVCVAFVEHGSGRGIEAINQRVVSYQAIAVVRAGLWRTIHTRLQAVEIAPGDHGPPHAGLRRAIHRRYAGRPFFLVPTTVSNSSNATVSTRSGGGGRSGTWSAAAVIQWITGW